jgi:GPH family glycoside/pentoside/hexuronide:cation symporter
MARPQPLPEPETAAPRAAGRVPPGTLLAYGPPVLALSGALFFVQFYFLKFATDVLLMAPLVVGAIFALGRAWDAISDPIVGQWSDRTNTRIGRRRPWMLGTLPLLVASFLMIWLPPASLSGVALAAWVAVALFGFYTAFTAYIIPHLALGAELTSDHHERSRIFGVRGAAFMLGMAPAFAGMQIVNNAEVPRDMAAGLALGIAAFVAVVLLIPPVVLRERKEFQGRGANDLRKAMRDVLGNPHARVLIFVQFIEMMGAGVLGILSPYLAEYVWKRPDMIGPLPAVFVGATVVSIPLWVYLSRRYGKRDVWRIAMLGAGLSFGGTVFVVEGEIGLVVVLLFFAGLSSGCGAAMGPSVMADVIDYDEYVTGERKEGAYSATNGFAIKAANAIIILLVALFLQFSDFTPNAEQTESTKWAFRLIYAGTPFTVYMVGAWIFGRFKLDEAEHARIRAELDARADAG